MNLMLSTSTLIWIQLFRYFLIGIPHMAYDSDSLILLFLFLFFYFLVVGTQNACWYSWATKNCRKQSRCALVIQSSTDFMPGRQSALFLSVDGIEINDAMENNFKRFLDTLSLSSVFPPFFLLKTQEFQKNPSSSVICALSTLTGGLGLEARW